MKRFLLVPLAMILASALIFGSCAAPAPAPAPAPAEPVVLKAIQARSIGHSMFAGWAVFVEEVNKRADGELTIEVIGSTDVMPLKEMGTAVISGVVDMGALFGGYLAELIPGIDLLAMSPFTYIEYRDGGAVD